MIKNPYLFSFLTDFNYQGLVLFLNKFHGDLAMEKVKIIQNPESLCQLKQIIFKTSFTIYEQLAITFWVLNNFEFFHGHPWVLKE